MKKKNWTTYCFWIVLMELIALSAWWIVADAIEIYQKSAVRPALIPADVVFYAIWGILYGLMGISLARIRSLPKSPAGDTGINFFIMQLLFNFFWGQIFFGSQTFGFALAWLVVMLVFLVLMILNFLRADRFAGVLQIPYLIWTIYALYLNIVVWLLNK